MRALDTTMPLVGRTHAVDKAWKAVMLHYNGWKAHQYDERNHHYRLFATGPQGIGKTRFGFQLPSLLAERACLDPNTPEELNKYLANVLCIPITFGNGSRITNSDLSVPNKQLAEWLLVTRAIYAFFKIDEAPEDFFASLVRKWNGNPPEWFSIKELANYLVKVYSTPNNKLTLYWHVDEFQSLLPHGVAVDAITILTSVYAKFAPTFSLLLLSGTLYESFSDALMKDNGAAEAPVEPIDLSLLTMTEVDELIDTAVAEGKLGWLQHVHHGKNNKPLRRLLSDSGGIPRMLEKLFGLCSDPKFNLDFSIIAEQLCSFAQEHFKIEDRTESGIQMAMAAQHWAFSGWPYAPSAKVFDGITLEDILSRGIIQCKKRGNILYPTIPFIFLSQSAPVLCLENLWAHLHDPANELSRADFEKVLLMAQILRVQALTSLGAKNIKLSELLPGAQFVNTEQDAMEDRQIQLKKQKVLSLTHCWPSAKLPWPVCRGGALNLKELEKKAFLNTAGASGIDGFQFFTMPPENNDEEAELLLLAHQIKFTSGVSKLTAIEVANSVHDFYSTLQHACKTTDGEAKKFLTKLSHNTLVLIVTNQQEEDSFVERLVELTSYPLAIVTNMEEFLGPLGSTLESFNVNSQRS